MYTLPRLVKLSYIELKKSLGGEESSTLYV